MVYSKFFIMNTINLVIAILVRRGNVDCSGDGCLGLALFSIPVIFALLYVCFNFIKIILGNKEKSTLKNEQHWQRLFALLFFGLSYLALLIHYKY